MNLNDLATFLRVAEAGTYAGAARSLGVPKSTISRRVARLEGALGVALLHRSARSFELTDEARVLVDRCGPALKEIARVEQGLGPSEPVGRLRMTVPIDLAGSAWFSALLASFVEAVPAVSLDTRVTNRRVDLLEEGIDLALRMHVDPLPPRDDWVARTIFRGWYGLYAAPGIGPSGAIDSVADLHSARLLGHAAAWRSLWPRTPDVLADDFTPLCAMAVAGAGVVGLPDFLADPEVEAGRLVRVSVADPAWAHRYQLSCLWLRTRHLAGRIRAFVDHAITRPRTARTP